MSTKSLTGTVKAESQYGYMVGAKWYNYVHDETIKDLVRGKFSKDDEVKIDYEEKEGEKGPYNNLLSIERVANSPSKPTYGWKGSKTPDEQRNIMKAVVLKGIFETTYWKVISEKNELGERVGVIAETVDTLTNLILGKLDE